MSAHDIPVSISGPRIAAVLRVVADYYGGCDDALTDAEVAARRSDLDRRLAALGAESELFAHMLYRDAIRFAPECWPDIPSETTFPPTLADAWWEEWA